MGFNIQASNRLRANISKAEEEALNMGWIKII